jgi:hypothetical protein
MLSSGVSSFNFPLDPKSLEILRLLSVRVIAAFD